MMSIIVYKDIVNKMTAYKNGDEITLDWQDSYLKRHQTKISQDVLDQVLVGDRSGEELQFYAEVGTWPLPKAEQEKYYEEHGINDMLAKIKKESEQNWSGVKKE